MYSVQPTETHQVDMAKEGSNHGMHLAVTEGIRSSRTRTWGEVDVLAGESLHLVRMGA